MDDFRLLLEATLLQFGFESLNQQPCDDELIQMVRRMGEALLECESNLESR